MQELWCEAKYGLLGSRWQPGHPGWGASGVLAEDFLGQHPALEAHECADPASCQLAHLAVPEIPTVRALFMILFIL